NDSVQLMTTAAMRLHIVRKSVTDEEEAAQLERLEQAIEAATARLRFLLFELHPPSLDSAGLAASLQSFMRMASPEGEYWFDVQDAIEDPPNDHTRLILYRIAQEALNNARKHADARDIRVRLSERDAGYVGHG